MQPVSQPAMRYPQCQACITQFAVDHAGEAALWMNQDLDFIYVNQAAAGLLDHAPEALLLMGLADISPQLLAELRGRAESEAPLSTETFCRTREGHLIPVEATVTRVLRDGRPFYCAFLRDIRDRRHLEEQLREAHKMEAVGRLVDGVVHDFNNLLTAVLIYSGLLASELHTKSRLRRHVDQVRLAAERGTALINQLLTFSRQHAVESCVISLESLMTGLRDLLQRLVGEDIELVTHCAPDLGAIQADPAQMEQVIVNLAVNARDAMPAGGRLAIEATNFSVDESFARRHLGLKVGEHVRLVVSDTGCGMDAETCSHVFEPFFTTKPRGKGTGLGLSTVYGTVKQSGGQIEVQSQPGRGTTVRILLPRVLAAAAATPAPQAPRQEQEGKDESGAETVLLVEDEDLVRRSLHEVLKRQGYHVLQARHGTEAMWIGEQYPGPIHLMVTDLVMPGMSGNELALRMAALRPEMRVLFISGYGRDARVQQLTAAGLPFVPKPFTAAILARKLREVLHPQQRLRLITKTG